MTWTLVTGGAKRLGAEVCRYLAAHGHHIIVHYNTSPAEAKELVKECLKYGVKSECIQGDFSSLSSTEDFINRYLNQYDCTCNVINNVGNYLINSALSTSIQDWYELFQTNLHSPFALIKALVPSIKKARGNIINIGIAGVDNVSANTYATAYNLTKAALWLLTKSLAKELAPFLVRVNMVSPGQLENSIDLPEDQTTLPMKRSGSLKEVARVIAFLLQENSNYITGQNITVAGGLTL
jgi:NAD(P)-dependent dehydrogenase (short-subunit alcohol dehydrogenase family)